MRINLEEEIVMNPVELTVDGSAIGNPGLAGGVAYCGPAMRRECLQDHTQIQPTIGWN